MAQAFTVEELDAVRTMVNTKTGSTYTARIIPTDPHILELCEHAPRVWMEGALFIDLKAGAEELTGRKLDLRELQGETRVLQFVPPRGDTDG